MVKTSRRRLRDILTTIFSRYLWSSFPLAQDGDTLRSVEVEVKVGRLAQPYPALHDAIGAREVAEGKYGETTVGSILKYKNRNKIKFSILSLLNTLKPA